MKLEIGNWKLEIHKLGLDLPSTGSGKYRNSASVKYCSTVVLKPRRVSNRQGWAGSKSIPLFAAPLGVQACLLTASETNQSNNSPLLVQWSRSDRMYDVRFFLFFCFFFWVLGFGFGYVLYTVRNKYLGTQGRSWLLMKIISQ